AAGAAARARPDTGAVALADPRAGSGSSAAALAGAVAVGLGFCFLDDADVRSVVGRSGHDRRDHDRELLGLERRFGLWFRWFRRLDNRWRLTTHGQRAAH